jgi:hypothetical protein
MSVTLSSECTASFESELDTEEPRRRTKRRGRPRNGGTEEEELKSSVRSKLDFEDFESEG